MGLFAWMPVVLGVISLALLVPELFKRSADPRARRSIVAIIAILIGALLSAVVRLSRIESDVVHYTVDAVMLGLTIFAIVQLKRAYTSHRNSASPS